MCNVPKQLNGEVLAMYLGEHGEVEDIIKTKPSNWTAHGDYFFTMCLNRKGFQAIPHTIEYESQIVRVIVEGRKLQCWFCKQLGHFSRQTHKPISPPSTSPPPTPLTTTMTTTTTTTTTAAATTKPTIEIGNHSSKSEEGWTQVTRGRKKKTPSKPTTTITPEKKIHRQKFGNRVGRKKTSKRKLQCHNLRSIHNLSQKGRKKTKLKNNA